MFAYLPDDSSSAGPKGPKDQRTISPYHGLGLPGSRRQLPHAGGEEWKAGVMNSCDVIMPVSSCVVSSIHMQLEVAEGFDWCARGCVGFPCGRLIHIINY
jgi:hypothetical protein